MNVELEISGCGIVLIGSFNPAIFHPSWFVLNGILTPHEADQIDLQVVHPEITQMSIGTINLTVEQRRFSIDTASAPWIKLADFASRIFGEVLPHTPIEVAGINYLRHFRLPSAQERVAFGRRLAPLDPWGSYGKRITSVLPDDSVGGVQILAMREFWADAPWQGWNQIKLEPSTQIPNNSGVYVEFNHHIQSAIQGQRIEAPELIAYITKKYDEVIADATSISNELFNPQGTK